MVGAPWHMRILKKEAVVEPHNEVIGSGIGRVKFDLVTFRVKWCFKINLVWVRSSLNQQIFSLISFSCENKLLCRKFYVGYWLIQVNLDFESTFGWAYFLCRVRYGSKLFGLDLKSHASFVKSSCGYSIPEKSRETFSNKGERKGHKGSPSRIPIKGFKTFGFIVNDERKSICPLKCLDPILSKT